MSDGDPAIAAPIPDSETMNVELQDEKVSELWAVVAALQQQLQTQHQSHSMDLAALREPSLARRARSRRSRRCSATSRSSLPTIWRSSSGSKMSWPSRPLPSPNWATHEGVQADLLRLWRHHGARAPGSGEGRECTKHETAEEDWELASMWDACLLLGCKSKRYPGGVGFVVTAYALVVFVINALIQTTIVSIVVYRLGNNSDVDDGTVADLRCATRAYRGPSSARAVCRQYRVNVAHALENVDPLTNVPLAAKVCHNMAGIPFSFQVDKFQDIVKYTQGDVGSLLCGLCGFMWFVKVRPTSAWPHV